MNVKIYKQGNLLRIRTSLASVFPALKKALRYRKAIYNATWAARQAAGGAHVTYSTVDCFEMVEVQKEKQLITPAGYYDRIIGILNNLKVEHTTKTLDDLMTRPRFKQNWDLVEDTDWRYGQKDTLKAMLAAERGQVWQATGAGKSWILIPLCLVMPKARIVVTTKHIQVLQEHFHRLSMHMGDVGIICSGKNIANRRVMCVSAGSLHHIDPNKVDVVVADEHHELGTENYLSRFAEFKNSRMYGLSANVNDRTDGADFELEAIFGPVLSKLTYQEGVENGMVVPLEVEWHRVEMDTNPASGLEGILRKKHGIWKNEERNKIIAQVARSYETEQVLITVETVEHACRLKQFLPEYELCYSVSEDSHNTVKTMHSCGVLPEPEPKMTPERMFNIKRNFELGLTKKVIATSVWNRGVNFHQLQVLIRADGLATSVADTQIPGRLSRLSEGKTHGKLVDFLDDFDDGLARAAKRRMAHYRSKGWKQIVPPASNSGKDHAPILAGSRRRRKSD